MGSPAELTILVLLVAAGVALWSMHDRLALIQRELEAVRRKLEAAAPPGEG